MTMRRIPDSTCRPAMRSAKRVAVFLVAAVVAGCGPDGALPNAPGEEEGPSARLQLASPVERSTSPGAAQSASAPTPSQGQASGGADTSNASAYHPAVAALARCTRGNGCPTTVPSDYVLTPSGWFHPSCIVPIDEDEEYDLLASKVNRRDGTGRGVAPCGHLPYDKKGKMFDPSARASHEAPAQNPQDAVAEASKQTPPPLISWDWLADIHNDVSVGGVSSIEATWSVPAKAPSPGAIIYLFPGVQNGIILQPVLGSDSRPDGWTIQSWACCDAGNNNLISSSWATARTGDSIFGTATGSSCNAATGVCSTWTINTVNMTTGGSSSGTLTNNTRAYGTGAGQVVAGALETYWVDRCAQLPVPAVSFLNVVVKDINAKAISPANLHWVNNDWATWPGHVPECWVKAYNYTTGDFTTGANIKWSLSGAPPFVAYTSILR